MDELTLRRRKRTKFQLRLNPFSFSTASAANITKTPAGPTLADLTFLDQADDFVSTNPRRFVTISQSRPLKPGGVFSAWNK